MAEAKPERHFRWGDLVSATLLIGLVAGVYVLPPDTSLAMLRESGVLRVCVPPNYPPLVVENGAEGPGFDIELLREVAARLDLRIVFATNAAITRDFNPRSWAITRAQCELIAGGVVGSGTTRSFLETSPAYLETGWAIVASDQVTTLAGLSVGFYSGLTGLDRLNLSRFLREAGTNVSVVTSRQALIEGLAGGRFGAVVTEALTAQTIAGAVEEWRVYWVPEAVGRYPITIGLWKGDLTLKRAVVGIIESLRREGFLEALAAKYRIEPIEGVFPPEG